jgi:hypothetical protein
VVSSSFFKSSLLQAAMAFFWCSMASPILPVGGGAKILKNG